MECALLALAGGCGALATRAALMRGPAAVGRWERPNHRGRPVSLLAGPAFVAAAGTTGALGGLLDGGPRRAAAAVLTALGAGLVGRYDDCAEVVGPQPAAKGFRGHLGALGHGEVTVGVVKVAGIGAAGLSAGLLVESEPRDALVAGALVAGCANLANLFDLRPGRVGKLALLVGVPLAVRARPAGVLLAGPLGAMAALLPADLAERGMLGDAGANALGGLLGLGLAVGLPARAHRLAVLAGVASLTAASEVVSFTRVIAAVPPLRWFDELGRLA